MPHLLLAPGQSLLHLPWQRVWQRFDHQLGGSQQQLVLLQVRTAAVEGCRCEQASSTYISCSTLAHQSENG